MCNIEFPHFGASYPDAHCINGYLWDMDSYENGCYTIGGDDPCPFCNTDAWLKTVLDNEEFASREEALEWVEKMREKWGAEHRGSSEIPKDLEEAANKFAVFYDQGTCDGIAQDCFIAGAKWQAEQDEKEQADLFTIVALDAAQRAKEQMMKDIPKWHKVQRGSCFDKYTDFLLSAREGHFYCSSMEVPRDGYILLVNELERLPKEDEK